MKYTLATFVCLGTMNLCAQQTFTDRLQQTVDSAGRIVLHQDKSITDFVNGTVKATPIKKKQVDVTQHDSTSVAVDSLETGVTVKMNGYRIQVYFGDNSRKGKTEARAAGLRFKNYFPNHSVYVSFVSPHWLCRVGDFRTMEEASECLREIRAMGIFREAVIVRSKIKARI